MKPSRFINLLVTFLFAAVAFANPRAVSANQPSLQTTGEITGDGQICNSRSECGDFSITFDPIGGPVTGSVNVTWPLTDPASGVKIGEEVLQGTLTGTFDGEDGGVVRGTIATGQVTVTYSVTCDTCTNGTQSVVGSPWEGNLRADGTGNGWIGNQGLSWNITYSAEDFQAGLGGSPRPTKTPGTATETPGTPQPILEGTTIHATGQVCNQQNSCGVIELTFNTAGGPVTGSFSGTFIDSWSSGSATLVTTTEESGTLSGMYSGGDGGTLSGTASTQVSGTAVYDGWDKADYKGANPIDGTRPIGPTNISREWNGVLNANGTGSGYVPCWVGGVIDGYFAYTVTFSAADFQAGLAGPTQAAVLPTETSQEYIQHQIGKISVEMGDKVWSEHEIQLIKEVLSQIPSNLLNKVSLKNIVRYASATDRNGNLNPDVCADYTNQSQTIRIYDAATQPYEFANDSGDTQFKSTILHEITHALQYYIDDQIRYDNPYTNPLLADYITSTGTIFKGWQLTSGKWVYWPITGNDPPTSYGTTNPKEDMSESVKMYVYNPQLLINSSPQRYNYIRERIYGGIEYDNGKQKVK